MNHTITLLIALLLGSFSPTRADLVAHFRFDGDLKDVTGQHDGRPFDPKLAPSFAPGRVGNAVVIEKVNAGIELANPSAIDFSRDFTLATWVNVGNYYAEMPVLFKGSADLTAAPELTKDYEQHLTHLIASLRRDLDAPQMKAVIAEINPAKVTPVSPFPCVDEVRATQRAFPAKDPLTICISTDGLTKAKDEVHYDTAGQEGLGLRFAEALQKLLAKDSQ